MRPPIAAIERHADEHGHRPATRRFTPSIYRQSPGYYKPFTINLHHLNEEIGKTRGGEYVRGTLNYVREEILSSPTIEVVKRHAPYVFEIKIIPFCDLKKIDESKEILTADDVVVDEQNADTETDTELVAEDAGIDHQQLIYTDRKCQSAGIVIQKKDLWRVARHPKEIIDLAINCFKSAELSQNYPIRNPAGWLICCLEKKYYLSYRFDKVVKSVEQKLFELQDWFIENVGSIPVRMDRHGQLTILSQAQNSCPPPRQLELFPKN